MKRLTSRCARKPAASDRLRIWNVWERVIPPPSGARRLADLPISGRATKGWVDASSVEQGPNGSRHLGRIDWFAGVDLDQWSDAKRSDFAAPQLCLDTQSVQVPLIPESVAIPVSRNVERDSASHLDDWSGERTNE